VNHSCSNKQSCCHALCRHVCGRRPSYTYCSMHRV